MTTGSCGGDDEKDNYGDDEEDNYGDDDEDEVDDANGGDDEYNFQRLQPQQSTTGY